MALSGTSVTSRASVAATGNRILGILHGHLTHHTRYNEQIAWAHRDEKSIPPLDTMDPGGV